MSIDEKVAFDLNDLPLDVFELADRGLAVESLTAGHGMGSLRASSSSCTSAFTSCTRDEEPLID